MFHKRFYFILLFIFFMVAETISKESRCKKCPPVVRPSLDPINKIVEKKICSATEDACEMMFSGINNITLEPFEKDHISFNLTHSDFGRANGTFDNLVLTNMSDFVMELIKYSWTSNSLKINVTFPILTFNGTYDLNGMGAHIVPIYGNGIFLMYAKQFHINVFTKLGIKNKQCQVKELDIDIILDKLECHFDNLMGGGENEELFNDLLSEIGPDIVNSLWLENEQILTQNLIKVINTALEEVPCGLPYMLKKDFLNKL